MADDDAPKSSRLYLAIAAAVLLAIRWFVPGGRWILYPFTLLGTWVHEMGHGIAAMLTGGHFMSLDVFANASGLAHTMFAPGLATALVAAGGLLAPPAVGASILALSRGPRRAQVVLWALSIALGVSLLFWVRSLAGWVVLPLLAAAIGAFARYGSARERLFVAQLIGLVLALDTWTGLDYLFMPSAIVDGVMRPSDIQNLANALIGPYQLWGVLLSVISLGMIGAGLAFAWRSPASARVAAPPLGVPTPASLRVGTTREEVLDEDDDIRVSARGAKRR
jgi:hypothetical protein